MNCARPISAWRDTVKVNSSGLHPILFKAPSNLVLADRLNPRYQEVFVPCGKCLLCRKRRAFEISVRARCEAALSPGRNYFITLTVCDDSLPVVFPNGKLNHIPWQLFAKRLRKHFPFRFLMCGEYGEKTHRPHYHAILFDVPYGSLVDSYFDQLGCFHASKLLEECWPYGNVMCAQSNDATVSYVAGYQLKKFGSDDEYASYVKWSRRPGLGSAWIDRFWRDVYRLDGKLFLDNGTELEKVVSSVIMHNQSVPFSSRFFENRLRLHDPQRFAKLKAFRENRSLVEQPFTIEMCEYERDRQVRRLKHAEYQLSLKTRDFT